VRAATPSAAAELVTPDQAEVASALADRRRRMGRALSGETSALRLRLENVAAARCFRQPFERIREASRRVDELAAELSRAASDRLRESRGQVAALGGRLEALSPVKVLARGYSVTWKGGELVRRADDVTPGDRIRTVFGDGEISSTVN
jgi:exodeoxyribonuclease VII large subunit